MASNQKSRKLSFSTMLLVVAIIASLFVGGSIGYFANSYLSSEKIANTQNQLANIQLQLQALQENVSRLQDTPTGTQDSAYQNVTQAIDQLQYQISGMQRQIGEIQAAPNTPSQNATIQTEITKLQNQLATIQEQIRNIQQTPSTPSVTYQNTYQNITYFTGENFSLSQLFDRVKTSIVVVQGLVRQTDFFGRVYYSQVQGSGFVYNHAGRAVILTNNHVVAGAINITVTFTDEKTYATTILGSNPNTDFAVLNTTASISNYTPLDIISSSTLKVGDPVIVVGTPYGLAGSMSNGIISALNRTLTASTNTEITNIIQTTTPLNPGNSGGPLMNYKGQVVGIATAIVQESQGIGFAIPSDTILSELQRMIPK